MVFQQKRQRQANIFFVVDEEKAWTFASFAGAARGSE